MSTTTSLLEAAATTTDWLSDETVLTNTIVACGMIDGVGPSKKCFDNPFGTFSSMLAGAGAWMFCYRVTRFFADRSSGASRRWLAVIPLLSVASMIYRKYKYLHSPPVEKEHPSVFAFSNSNGLITLSFNFRNGL